MARKAKAPAIMVKGAELSKELIQSRLANNDAWLFRAIVAIFEYQTADEQNAEVTAHDNGVGFNSVDATILSSFAKQIMEHAKGASRFASPLSPKQKEMARKRMNKYAGQLLRIAQSRSATVQV